MTQCLPDSQVATGACHDVRRTLYGQLTSSITRTVSEDGTATIESPDIHEIQRRQRRSDVLESAFPLSHNRGHDP
jgi:hypothetical protein